MFFLGGIACVNEDGGTIGLGINVLWGMNKLGWACGESSVGKYKMKTR